jgi:hypothetical protein
VVWLIITPGFEKGPEKLLLLSSLEGSNLVRISKSLLPGRWSVLQRLCPFLGGSFLEGAFSFSLLYWSRFSLTPGYY